MSHGFNRLLQSSRLIKPLFELNLRNEMNGSVLHIAVSTEEAPEVLRPASKNLNVFLVYFQDVEFLTS